MQHVPKTRHSINCNETKIPEVKENEVKCTRNEVSEIKRQPDNINK